MGDNKNNNSKSKLPDIDKKFIKLAKKKILQCLTEDIEYGINKRTGKPLKRRKISQAIFDKKEGFANYTQTDLEMVMDKVVLGLYFAYSDFKGDDTKDNFEVI